MEYCKDHQECRDSAIRLKAEFDVVKADGHSKLDDLTDEVTDVWLELKTKLTSKAFAWVIGGLVFIMVIIMSANWTLLIKIDDKVDKIAVMQGKIQGKLDINEHPK